MRQYQREDRLPYEEMREAVASLDLEVGEQSKQNHEHCPAGQDTKRRLYIKRATENDYLFFCHHCNQSGRYRLAGGTGNMAWYLDTEARAGNRDDILKRSEAGRCGQQLNLGKEPEDAIKEFRKWPVKAQTWLLKYGITEAEVTKHGIYYSDTGMGVCMPVFSGSVYLGTVVRTDVSTTQPLGARVTRGKYKTFRQNATGRDFIYIAGVSRHCLVIVEDILSAIKMGRHATAVALLGVHSKDAVVRKAKDYDRVIVYLDNDNRAVRNKQVVLKNQIALVNPNVSIYRSDKDPKECSDEELLQIVNGSK